MAELERGAEGVGASRGDPSAPPEAERGEASEPLGVPGIEALSRSIEHHLAVGLAREPWLFFREGWDWRFWSWGRCAQELCGLARVCRSHSGGWPLDGTPSLGMPFSGAPSLLLLGLSLSAGGVAVRGFASREQAVAAGMSWWVDGIGFRLESLTPSAAVAAANAAQRDAPGERAEGLEPAARLRVLAKQWPAPRTAWGRHVVVEAEPFRDELARAGLSWALASRAAVALAPSPGSWIDVVLWARPTVLWVSAEQLDVLSRRLDRWSSRRSKKRLDRLSVVLCNTRDAPDAAVAERLRHLGIEVQRFQGRF